VASRRAKRCVVTPPSRRLRCRLEAGASEAEVVATVQEGERFPAKIGGTGFRRTFHYDGERRGRRYATKQVEALAVEENGWLVITVIVKYF